MKAAYDGALLPPVSLDELSAAFSSSERRDGEEWIGAESEKIGVHETKFSPLGYGQAFGVCKVIEYLAKNHHWEPVRETDDGPVLGLVRGAANITLEPGAQFELSGAAVGSVHEVADEQARHLFEIAEISRQLGIAWLGTGFQPLAKLEELPWVPKQRYPIMRSYLPTKGSGAHDMMQRTATVQVNFDRRSEADGMKKLAVGLRLSPLVHALSANAPFREGKRGARLSERGNVWLHMDPSRSGLIPSLWRVPADKLRYRDYAEWALDAGMFLFWRNGEVIENTGQTFRDFLKNGYQGHHATALDWKLHLTTLFPEARLKNTLEVRSADAQRPDIQLAVVALWVGILYGGPVLDETLDWVSSFDYDQVMAARPELVTRGLRAEARPFGNLPNFAAAERLIGLAKRGLSARNLRRADGKTEDAYLEPLEALIARGQHPADDALERYQSAQGSEAERIVSALRYALV